jgi:trimethylamine--corrinoid protein Co-methyltransferase
MTDKNGRRSGGRNARRAARAAPLSRDLQPVKPGMKSNAYNPLTEAGENRIHSAALDALETIGLGDVPESGMKSMVTAGAIYGNDGRIRFLKVWLRICCQLQSAISLCVVGSLPMTSI